jgi:YD repeat-containing protein
MVAIVAGNGLGLQSSSALGLGDRGRIGNASFGQTGEQIYVNAATGNLVIQDRDELLLGQGVNSQIYRAYNSQGKMVGDNWRPGGMKTVDGLTGMVNTAGSTVTRTDWDGSAITYFYDSGSNTYGPITGLGARDALSFDAASSTWNWVDGSHRLSEAYDANHGGRLVTSRDRDGNTVSYTYNANGLLSQVRTASGDVTWLDYNGAQQLAALRTVYQSASGQQITATTVRYAYDSQGRLSEVVVDLTPEDNSVADSKVFKTTYTYDGVSSRIVSITQSDGSSVAFSYKLVEGDYRVSCIAQTSDVGTVRRTYLDYQPAAKTTTITDPLGLVTVLRYDRNNRLTSIMSPAAGGASREQNFAYDPYGRVSLVEDNELSIQYRYDSQGNLDWQRDRAGNRVERTYGADNQLLTETVINLQGTSSTTRYVYDTQNHVRFMVSAVGRVTEYRYNALGQQTSVLSYSGALYTATSASETELSNWVAALADRSQGTRVDTDYDFRGNVVNVTQYGKLLADGSGDANAGAGEMTRVRYVYDPFGRLLQRIAGDAGHPQIEQFAYDGLGRLVSATKFDGTVTLYQYDDTRHQTVVTFSNGLSRTSTYDAAGELVSVTESSPGKVLSQIHNQYDGDGHLRMSSDATGRVTHYLYDEIGRAVARIDPEGAMVEYTYTPGGLLVSTTQYATPVSAAALGSLVDGGGRPVEMVIVGGKSVALTLANANVRPVASQADRTDWRGYDDAGRLTATANANGSVVRYQYDGAGRLTARTECAGTADVTKGNPAQR